MNTFAPTQWDSATTKAAFARQFIKFVESDFSMKSFPKTFYTRLSMTFGHIAHYNQIGFFDTFFRSTVDKVRFLRMTLRHSCCGDPKFTYCDVEKFLQNWLEENEILDKYEYRLDCELEEGERAMLASLKLKYPE